MQHYELFLKEWILNGHREWKNNVYGQCKSWLDNGLQPRAMTRDSNWGIKVPLPDAEGKFYMYGSMHHWVTSPPQRNSHPNGGLLATTRHQTSSFIGKDNIVFHCIIFPRHVKSTWSLRFA
ncbi:MAG: class I tRNA ligase family protein [Puia sp.]